MATIAQKIRALVGTSHADQSIELPELRFRDGTDKATRSDVTELIGVLARGERPQIRAISPFGCRAVTRPSWDADDGEWTRTSAFDDWQRADEAGSGLGLLEFIAVSEGVKRDGSIVRVDGIDTTNLARNPVFLWAHNLRQDLPPIGRIVAIKKADHLELGRVLLIRVAPLATTEGTEHIDFARMILAMYENGDMHAVSFGWVPTEYDVLYDEDGYFAGFDFLRSDALETSAVPVPADPDALKAGFRSGKIPAQYQDAFVARMTGAVHVLREAGDPKPVLRGGSQNADKTKEVDGRQPPPLRSTDKDLIAKLAGPVRTAVEKNDTAALVAKSNELLRAGKARGDILAAIDTIRAAIAAEHEEQRQLEEGIDKLFAEPVVETRAGKVLSRKNRETVQAAHDALQAVEETAAGARVTLRGLLDATADGDEEDRAPVSDDAATRLRQVTEQLGTAAGLDTESLVTRLSAVAQRLGGAAPTESPSRTASDDDADGDDDTYGSLYRAAERLKSIAPARA